MSKTKVVFRADGNSEIGLGHVIRSLALADILKGKFECIFAIQEPSKALHQQIETVCTRTIILPTCEVKNKGLIYELHHILSGNEIVVLDGYKFTTAYQQYLKRKGCIVVCIDDIHSYHFVSDVIINPSGGVSSSDYSAESYTRHYLGPQYVLLRQPFLQSHKKNRPGEVLRSLFINMGGADPNNHTCEILSKIGALSFFEKIHMVTGSAYKFSEALNKTKANDKRILHHSELDAHKMANLMHACGVAVCPPSSVAFEYASVSGLLFLKQIADNQKEVKTYFIEQQIALDFDLDFERLSNADLIKQRQVVMTNQSRVFDGKSDERLASIFSSLQLATAIRLRQAEEKDLMICYEWANDVEVRSASYDPASITLADHTKWFIGKIQNEHCHFYIAEYRSKPIGQIRFEGSEEKIISYLLDATMRGKGFGNIILSKGVEQLLREAKSTKKIIGYVKKSNIASCKAFEKAGFSRKDALQDGYEHSFKYELVPLN